MLNASIDLLRYLGKDKHAEIIDKAIKKTISEDQVQTPDIGGAHSGDQMIECVTANIKELLKTSDLKLF